MAKTSAPTPRAKTLAQALRAAREAAGLTQYALAQAIGMAPNHLARLESGERHVPRFDTIAKIAVELGVSLDMLAAECGYRSDLGAGIRSAAPAKRAVNLLRSLRSELQSADAVIDSAISELESVAGSRKPASRRRVKPR